MGKYITFKDEDELYHYGRKGMKKGMNIFNPDYKPIGKKSGSYASEASDKASKFMNSEGKRKKIINKMELRKLVAKRGMIDSFRRHKKAAKNPKSNSDTNEIKIKSIAETKAKNKKLRDLASDSVARTEIKTHAKPLLKRMPVSSGYEGPKTTDLQDEYNRRKIRRSIKQEEYKRLNDEIRSNNKLSYRSNSDKAALNASAIMEAVAKRKGRKKKKLSK